MKKILILFASAGILCGCTMFQTWKAIPPPGGCADCHTEQISNNWQFTVKPVVLTDETGRNAWQRPESVLPPESSPLEQQKISELRCFRCHKGPNKAHVERKGRYHH